MDIHFNSCERTSLDLYKKQKTKNYWCNIIRVNSINNAGFFIILKRWSFLNSSPASHAEDINYSKNEKELYCFMQTLNEHIPHPASDTCRFPLYEKHINGKSYQYVMNNPVSTPAA